MQDSLRQHVEVLTGLASRVSSVGWGLDLTAGCADILYAGQTLQLAGERWLAQALGSPPLRVPKASSRPCLERRHQAFLKRLEGDKLNPVPPLPPAAYEHLHYRRDWEQAALPWAAFSLLQTDGDKFQAFTSRNACCVAAMLRHAVAEVAQAAGWPEENIQRMVQGHAEKRGEEKHRSVGQSRFAYVPLPNLEPRRRDGPASHPGMIRRALIYIPQAGHSDKIAWLRRAFPGCELVEEGAKEPDTLVSLIPQNDRVAVRYAPLDGASVWATVTPLVLPGNVDRKQDLQRLRNCQDAGRKRILLSYREQRIDALIRKAVLHAGFSSTLAEHALIDWRKVGYWPGAERVDRYRIPRHLRKFPTFHVRIAWRDAQGNPAILPGPLVLGAGRFCGLGLFAAEDDFSSSGHL